MKIGLRSCFLAKEQASGRFTAFTLDQTISPSLDGLHISRRVLADMAKRQTGKRKHNWLTNMRLVIVTVYNELFRTRVFEIAGGVAYFFLLSLIPLLFVFSSALGYLHIPNLFDQLLNMMATLVPANAMSMVETILSNVLTSRHGGLLSFSILGYLWAASGGFTSLINALNVAYDVTVPRPWWRDRVQALLLTFTSGMLAAVSLMALIAGPYFGHFLVEVFPVPRAFGALWPALRLAVMFVAFVAGLELIYLLGPNTRNKFLRTLPGATLAVAVWFLGSFGLSFYLRHMSSYSSTYGPLGAVIGLMLWFYITACAILIGAELNAELTKLRREERTRSIGGPRPIRPKPAA